MRWVVAAPMVLLAMGVALSAGAGPTQVDFDRHLIDKGCQATSVFSADIDGDGDIDVVSGWWCENKVVWHENDGGSPPGFAERTISTNKSGVQAVYATDIDGDGDIDVLSASEFDDTVAWYENDGDVPPAFTEHTISTAVDFACSVYAADVDGDGDTDVVSCTARDISSQILWFNNRGGQPPTFTKHTISQAAPSTPASVFATDVDGDGDVDVLSNTSTGGSMAWYESDGGSLPRFTEHVVGSGTSSVHGADVDGDGDTDVLAATSRTDRVAWYENDGGTPPAFTEHTISSAADGAFSVFAADVDGDGDTDVLSGSGDEVAWFESDGGSSPEFTEHTIAQGLLARSVRTADVDGDGDQDVLAADAALPPGGSIVWFENRPVGPTLQEPDPGLAGRSNTLEASGATPSRRVALWAGRNPGSTAVPGCPGVEVGIATARVTDRRLANEDGGATFVLDVPAGLAGSTVLFQVVEASTCRVGNLVEFAFPIGFDWWVMRL